VTTVSLNVDNVAAIKATGLIKPAPSHHLWDTFHQRLTTLRRKHNNMTLTIRWTPGHLGIEGNEAADVEAKEAAKGGSSERAKLPAPLRKPLPHSKSAVRAHFHKKLQKQAKRHWLASHRAEQYKNIDPSLPSRKYLQLINNMPRKHASILTQLRTKHIPLNAYLYRFKKVDSPLCPGCRRADETVHHFLALCPAHNHARRNLLQAAHLPFIDTSALLSTKILLPHLLRYIAQTKRLKSIYGDLKALPEGT
jgi:hypothetical protein